MAKRLNPIINNSFPPVSLHIFIINPIAASKILPRSRIFIGSDLKTNVFKKAKESVINPCPSAGSTFPFYSLNFPNPDQVGNQRRDARLQALTLDHVGCHQQRL